MAPSDDNKNDDPADDLRPERNYWQLMPKRTLIKGIWLLLMLVAIIWFQAQAPSCARTFTETIAPAPATTGTDSPRGNSDSTYPRQERHHP